MKQDKIDGIIFDLDGTLWDCTETVAASWNRSMRNYGVKRDEIGQEEILRCMGKLIDDIGIILFQELPEEKARQMAQICAREQNSVIAEVGGVLYPDLQEALERLKQKYPLYIVSNCADGYIEAFFAAHHLEAYFSDYENPGRTGLPKAENIHLLMERNHLHRPVYVGDTEGDYQSACKAGVEFIHAAYGFGTVQDTVPELGSLAELETLLERMNASADAE